MPSSDSDMLILKFSELRGEKYCGNHLQAYDRALGTADEIDDLAQRHIDDIDGFGVARFAIAGDGDEGDQNEGEQASHGNLLVVLFI